MSNESRFDLTLHAAAPDELRRAVDFLQAAPWEWLLEPIERRLGTLADERERFRCRAHVTANEADDDGDRVTGRDGILAGLLARCPAVRVAGRFDDERGFGALRGVARDYEHRYAGDDGVEPPDLPPELVVWSGTALAPEAGPFAARLEAIGLLLLRWLKPAEVACTLVDEATRAWTVSALVETTSAQDAELCHELRRLRVPLDTCLDRGERANFVWPVSQRPWRRLF